MIGQKESITRCIRLDPRVDQAHFSAADSRGICIALARSVERMESLKN